MKHKRLYRSWLGIPIYLIIGLSIFIILTGLWDFLGETSRIIIMASAGLIIIISILLNRIKLKTLGRIASKQMGV